MDSKSLLMIAGAGIAAWMLGLFGGRKRRYGRARRHVIMTRPAFTVMNAGRARKRARR